MNHLEGFDSPEDVIFMQEDLFSVGKILDGSIAYREVIFIQRSLNTRVFFIEVLT